MEIYRYNLHLPLWSSCRSSRSTDTQFGSCRAVALVVLRSHRHHGHFSLASQDYGLITIYRHTNGQSLRIQVVRYRSGLWHRSPYTGYITVLLQSTDVRCGSEPLHWISLLSTGTQTAITQNSGRYRSGLWHRSPISRSYYNLPTFDVDLSLCTGYHYNLRAQKRPVTQNSGCPISIWSLAS
jgi:hypothetical protein